MLVYIGCSSCKLVSFCGTSSVSRCPHLAPVKTPPDKLLKNLPGNLSILISMRMFLRCGLALAAWLGAAAQADAAAPGAVVAEGQIAAACIADSHFQVGGSQLSLSYDSAAFAVGPARICAWAVRSALAVKTYYGRFPVSQVHIVIKSEDGDGVHGGTTYGESDEGHPLIIIRLGRDTGAAKLEDDWTMTHEMVHLSVPSVPENSHWLEEGIATYVEPIARVQQGQLDPPRIWTDMLHGMRKGLPAQGDRGLDNTPTWGRTYWGGALFCLLADVEIRERTSNRKGLQDALRGVLAAGGNIQQDWSVERIFAVGDKATGVPVLTGLYHQMGDSPMPGRETLDALWQALGVQADGGSIHLDDNAPLAASRRAITAPAPGGADRAEKHG